MMTQTNPYPANCGAHAGLRRKLLKRRAAVDQNGLQRQQLAQLSRIQRGLHPQHKRGRMSTCLTWQSDVLVSRSIYIISIAKTRKTRNVSCGLQQPKAETSA
eukprot:2259810-Amphidinium_carterae.1